MNCLFLTQNRTLDVFHNTLGVIKSNTSVGKAGFYVADSFYFNEYYNILKKDYPSLNYEFLKEWEIIGKAKKCQLDIKILKKYEKKIGDPVLWNVLMGDRRIFLGKKASLEQDYAPRFNHKEMLKILQTGLLEMESLFDKVKPDVVMGFICVTLGDYLAYLISKDRNIPFINLRPTRILNYFFAGESVKEPSVRLEKKYQQFLQSNIPEELKQKAQNYLYTVRKTHAMYEGVIPVSGAIKNTTPKASKIKKVTGFFRRAVKKSKRIYDYNYGTSRNDTHYRGEFYQAWYRFVKYPIRLRQVHRILKDKIITEADLPSIEYAFYPLHKEPEVTLLVYGRPFVNQVEVIRNYARSLPVGMKLLIKEHPGAVGYRPVSYFKKLMDIPNIIFVSTEVSSRLLIEKASLICVVGGSIGFEGAIMKKPVVVLGRAPFNILPETMIKCCRHLDKLAYDIRHILENYCYDDKALVSYISAVMNESVSVDFYSRLIGREGVYQGMNQKAISDEKEERKKQFEILAKYLIRTYDRFKNNEWSN